MSLRRKEVQMAYSYYSPPPPSPPRPLQPACNMAQTSLPPTCQCILSPALNPPPPPTGGVPIVSLPPQSSKPSTMQPPSTAPRPPYNLPPTLTPTPLPLQALQLRRQLSGHL